MTYHTCPVCGYNKLLAPAGEGVICPSCGTQFGYHDFTFTVEQLRERWLAQGAKWHSRVTLPPDDWNPYQQLARITKSVTTRVADRTT
jgi:rubredoxin